MDSDIAHKSNKNLNKKSNTIYQSETSMKHMNTILEKDFNVDFINQNFHNKKNVKILEYESNNFNVNTDRNIDISFHSILHYDETYYIKNDPETSDCSIIEYNNKSTKLASGYFDGTVNIYEITKNSNFKLLLNLKLFEAPITHIKWKEIFSYENIYISSSNGKLSSYFVDEKNDDFKIKLIYTIKEDHGINFFDILQNENILVTCSNDYKIRLYDENTKVIIHTFDNCHSNRVFCVKFFNKILPFTIISGGWDKSILFNDYRKSKILNDKFRRANKFRRLWTKYMW